MIVECNVWCIENDQSLIDMGLPEGDRWMPAAVDFSMIRAIKLAGASDFLGDDKSTVYFGNDSTTIDIPYSEAVAIWRKIKNSHHEQNTTNRI